MKLHPEDPRLTAYVLGELGPEEAAAVERAAAADPALQAEIRETQAIQQLLAGRLALPAEKLLPRQRENIRRAARDADRAAKVVPFASLRDALQPWLIPAAAAAVLALATFILIRMPADKPNPEAKSPPAPGPAPTAVAGLPAPAPAGSTTRAAAPPLVIPAPEPDLPALVRRGSVAAADFPTLDLPVHPGKSNLELISKSIRNDGQLPPRDAVRLEGILNGFSYRLNGVAAIARSAANGWHPDNRGSGMSSHLATLSTEMIACPWKPSATLLLISLRGNVQNDCEVKIAFHANPENVFRYRLLGFAPAEGKTAARFPTKLAANSTATLAIEIEPSNPASNLGSLEWSTDDKTAPPISLIHRSDAEPSDDARFAALVCTYGQWLAGEQAGIIDADIVAALAREIAAATLPADRADFLNLIDKSLHL